MSDDAKPIAPQKKAPRPRPGEARPGEAAEAANPNSLAAQYKIFADRRKAGQPVEFDALLRAFAGALLKPGDVAIDLGAYRGGHTVAMAEAVRGEGGAVHAVEPNPAALEPLRRRLSRPALQHVTLHEVAVGAEAGEAEFVVLPDAQGMSGLRARVPARQGAPAQTIRVPVATLDGLFGALERLAYIKADLEGGEFDALRGGDALIRRLRPVIAFDLGRTAYAAYGVDPGAVFDWFAARDYVLFDVVGNVLLTRDRFLRSEALAGLTDYIAVPSEKRELRRLVRAQAELLKAMDQAPPEAGASGG
jgi:FkbM family methyltransferase